MSEITTTTTSQKSAIDRIANTLISSGPQFAKNPVARKAAVGLAEHWIMDGLKNSRSDPKYPAGVNDDRTVSSLALLRTVERLFTEYDLADSVSRGMFNVIFKDMVLNSWYSQVSKGFYQKYGEKPPSFLTISPSKACNLQCTGCYADSGPTPEKLPWTTVDRIITEAKTLWGMRMFIISGGEPLAYRSEGKGLLDLVEKHNDCFFLMFTNSTLINDSLAERIAKAGNLTPAISVEGWRERTDGRRGAGVYDRVLAAMDRLHGVGVPFGISLTATRYNTEEILSDEFVDYFFMQKKALYGWIFQYMPIGRSFTLDLMPTPQQRIWLWHRSWEIMRQKRLFLVDFWNHGTLCEGCFSAGGSDAGGYFYIDWNGNMSPCVFVPYSPVNISKVYASGGTLQDAWENPFFSDLRNWQRSYKHGNMINPCPNRDHHEVLEQLITRYEPEPIDENARAALLDPDYSKGLKDYNREYRRMADVIWEKHYVHPQTKPNNHIADLPDLNDLLPDFTLRPEPEPAVEH
jgi:MoaA/NifB/PqqE/SkfB family radical SAM enzyme